MIDTPEYSPDDTSIEVLTIVAARGGSKRLPNQNIRLLGGKPLVVWAIENALNSKLVTRVVLSTESDEIAEIGKAAGAEVPFMRPAELAADDVSRLYVVLHAMNWLHDHDGYKADFVSVGHPTAPFADGDLMDRCIERIAADPNADSIHTIYPITSAGLHPLRAWKVVPDAQYSEPYLSLPSVPYPHDAHPSILPKAYAQNYYCDVTRWETLLEGKVYYGDNVIPYIMTAKDDIDIDTLEDLDRAERHLQALKEER